MKIYEVTYWGSNGDGDAKDTNYLVRAPDHLSAVFHVQINASPSYHNGEHQPLAHKVSEVGLDLSQKQEEDLCILRGPYFEHAYSRGWVCWHREPDAPDEAESWVKDGTGEQAR